MIFNYLKVALRNVARHKGFSIINIAGLAIGMTCCILIMLWVQDEMSYDSFHEHAGRLYRVTDSWNSGGQIEHSAMTPVPLGPALKEECSEIICATRFNIDNDQLIRCGDKSFQNDIVAWADNDFLEMFTFPLLLGDYRAALVNPNSIVISENLSDRYFGDQDPRGKTVNIGGRDFTVTAVMRNVPQNSHMKFDCLVPFDSRPERIKKLTDKWQVSAYFTYVLLEQGVAREKVVEKMNSIMIKYIPDTTSSRGLQPVKDIHLHSAGLKFSEENQGNIKYIYMFTSMAFLILLIACINFMNLSTARSSNRAKEIGIRKVVGAAGINIKIQFIIESVFLALLAMMLSIALIEIILPVINTWLTKSLKLDYIDSPKILLGLIALAFFTGIAAGSYPAFFLSSFKPAKILKGNWSFGQRSAIVRKTLVAIQFMLSGFLIIGSFVIHSQLTYMTEGDLGFSKDHLLTVFMRGGFQENYENIKNQLQRNPYVISVSAGWPPESPHWASNDIDWDGKEPDNEIIMCRYNVDFGYTETLGMKIVRGRSFSEQFSSDMTEAFIVNEEAVRQMGMENPIGQRFVYEGREGTIIGVVQDFHLSSLHDPIYPLVLQMDPEKLYYLCVKVDPEGTSKILGFLEKRWQETTAEFPFQYFFLDETIDNFYKEERRMGDFFNWAMVLAIFISCMGLFGLAAFSAEQRTKEMGIRKVFGASITNIIRLLSREFVFLIFIANLIAWPIAYLVMSRWLENFAYRTAIGIETFLIAGLSALIMTLLIVSYQALKTALANPVDSLRYE